MTLKLIPFELFSNSSEKKAKGDPRFKSFNPGNKIKKNKISDLQSGFKNICLKLIHYINRGSHFTYEQIDDLIMHLHRGILVLQKKKQELLKSKKR